MTPRAWLLTTWGKVRETLQPELFALRRELARAKEDRARLANTVWELREQIGLFEGSSASMDAALLFKGKTIHTLQNERAALMKSLARLNSKYQKVEAENRALKKSLQDGAEKKKRLLSSKRVKLLAEAA